MVLFSKNDYPSVMDRKRKHLGNSTQSKKRKVSYEMVSNNISISVNCGTNTMERTISYTSEHIIYSTSQPDVKSLTPHQTLSYTFKPSIQYVMEVADNVPNMISFANTLDPLFFSRELDQRINEYDLVIDVRNVVHAGGACLQGQIDVLPHGAVIRTLAFYHSLKFHFEKLQRVFFVVPKNFGTFVELFIKVFDLREKVTAIIVETPRFTHECDDAVAYILAQCYNCSLVTRDKMDKKSNMMALKKMREDTAWSQVKFTLIN